MPRPRKPDPTIPAHIDQSAIPRGIYWSAAGRYWFTNTRTETGGRTTYKVADASAKLSELHALAEQARAEEAKVLTPKIGTVDWILGEFHASPTFRALAPRTQADYARQRKVVAATETKVARLSALEVSKLTVPFMQRICDRIAAQTPTKANHLMRYLRRVFAWGITRGLCTSNPVDGIEMAKERKRRRLPSDQAHERVLELVSGTYLFVAMELAYLCRLRGIEANTLTDWHVTPEGLRSNRTKGSRDNITQMGPRLKAAIALGQQIRAEAWATRRHPTPIDPKARRLIVSPHTGAPLSKSGLDTAWQRMMTKAIADGVLLEEDRFSLHDLKRKGATDYQGTRAEKIDAGGWKSASMADVYDLSVPIVRPTK